eukprot:CFRG0883T1
MWFCFGLCAGFSGRRHKDPLVRTKGPICTAHNSRNDEKEDFEMESKHDTDITTEPAVPHHESLSSFNEQAGIVLYDNDDADSDGSQSGLITDGLVLPMNIITSISVACCTSILLGYDEGIMSGAVQSLRTTLNLSDLQTDIMMGSLNFWAAFGTLTAGKVSDRYGRRFALGATTIQLIIGPLLMCTATTYTQLMLGRIVTGLGAGFAFVVAPLYAAEIAPSHIRGTLVAVAEVCINFGVFVGYTMAFAFHTLPPQWNWRVMIGVAVIVPILTLMALPFIPESPRWLASQGRRERAKMSLKVLYKDESLVTYQMNNIDQMLEEESKLEKGSWKEIFRPSVVTRRALTAGIGIAIYQQISGSEAVVYYTPSILVNAGLGKTEQDSTVLLMTMAVGFAKFSSAGVAAYTIEEQGRRPTAMVSCFGTAACLCGLGIASAASLSVLAVVLLCLFMILFELGLGPLPTVIGSEVYDQRIRARAMSFGLFLNRIISGTIASVFPMVTDAVGAPASFYVFSAIGFTGVVFSYLFIPETKGLSLEDVQKLFAGESSVMKNVRNNSFDSSNSHVDNLRHHGS